MPPARRKRFRAYRKSCGDALTLRDARGWIGIRNVSLPGTTLDYQSIAGDPWLNSASSICLNWLVRNFAEPPLQVVQLQRGGKENPLDGHALIEATTNLENRPSDPVAFYAGLVVDLCCDGNALQLKVRSGAGKVVGLDYVPRSKWTIVPDWTDPAFPWIRAYRIRNQYVEPQDVVHYRYGTDPLHPWLGLGPLVPILREIATDNSAATYSAAILKNFGVPALYFGPVDSEQFIDEVTHKKLAAGIASAYSGDGAGKTMISDTALKPDKMGFSPDELAIEKIRDVPESRICAALGVAAMVVGLSVGARQRTYSNYAEAERQTQLNGLVPLQKIVARTLESQVLPDLEADPSRYRVTWDWSKVPALQDSMADLETLAIASYEKGLRQLNEARAIIKEKPVVEGDQFFVLPMGSPDDPPEPASSPFGQGDPTEGEADDEKDDGGAEVPPPQKGFRR